MNLAWELLNKEKKKVLRKVLEPDKNFKSVWIKAY